MTKKYSTAKIILVVWLVFSALYVLRGEYNRLSFIVADTAYNRGVGDTAMRLINQSKECKPIPVVAGEKRVEVIDIACLQAPEESSDAVVQ